MQRELDLQRERGHLQRERGDISSRSGEYLQWDDVYFSGSGGHLQPEEGHLQREQRTYAGGAEGHLHRDFYSISGWTFAAHSQRERGTFAVRVGKFCSGSGGFAGGEGELQRDQ